MIPDHSLPPGCKESVWTIHTKVLHLADRHLPLRFAHVAPTDDNSVVGGMACVGGMAAVIGDDLLSADGDEVVLGEGHRVDGGAGVAVLVGGGVAVADGGLGNQREVGGIGRVGGGIEFRPVAGPVAVIVVEWPVAEVAEQGTLGSVGHPAGSGVVWIGKRVGRVGAGGKLLGGGPAVTIRVVGRAAAEGAEGGDFPYIQVTVPVGVERCVGGIVRVGSGAFLGPVVESVGVRVIGTSVF